MRTRLPKINKVQGLLRLEKHTHLEYPLEHLIDRYL
jgi:hypothetical protein